MRPSGGFVWRTPLLPVDDLRAWRADLTAADILDRAGPGDQLRDAVAADRATLRDRLAVAVERAEVREAITVGSPGLESVIDVWREHPTGKRGRRIERTLVRYLTRMATRPTPFGLFAGISTGALQDGTDLLLAGRQDQRRGSQIDTDVLFALADHLGRDADVRRQVELRPNDSHYRVAGQVRYVQAHHDGERRAYRLATLPDHPAVARLLERAEHGARHAELVAALVEDGYDADAADRAVDRLVERQALVADLGFGVTGTTSTRMFIDDLQRLEPTRRAAEQLAEADDLLRDLDTSGIGASPDRYRAVAKALHDLPGVETPDDPFHVVLTKPAPHASLGPRVLAAAQRAVTVLHAQSRSPVDGPLETFRDAFVARYDTREVPLVEALDGEAGVGYGRAAHPAPLLRGVPFPGPPAATRWTPREDLLLAWVGRVLDDGEEDLRLGDGDLDALRATGEPPPLPRALAVFGTLLASDGEAVDRGAFRLAVDGAVGPSGARLLGRFCHADADVHRIVTEHLRAEEAGDPDAIHAEIVHLPAGREGNVVLRPVLRDVEIPYLGRSGAPAEGQLPVTDLLVSVRGGRVVLRSRRHGRRIEPRLTSAHNTRRRSLPMYRFLADLQYQGIATDLVWSWGPLAALPFLPRVSTGQLVLAPAAWRVAPDELAGVHDLDDAGRFAAVRRWQQRRGLPDLVRVAQYDQRLVVDLRNVLSIDSFLHLARQHATDDQPVLLQEAFLDDADLPAHGPEGRYVHELVVPLVRDVAPAGPPNGRVGGSVPRTVTGSAQEDRRLPPGSPWLYAKLFVGPASADAVLTEVVAPLREQLRADSGLDRWFFLRFGDPDWHLRVRLHGSPQRLAGEALPALQEALAPLLADGRVHRLQLDTYERELEALGGPAAIDHMEQLFEADSDTVVALLATLPRGDDGLDARWRLALYGMHRALLDLGLDLDARRSLLATLREGYAREHRVDVATKREMGRRFREERAAIEALVSPGAKPPDGLIAGVAAIDRRREAWDEPIARLRALDEQRELTVPWTQLAERVLHLHANRLLRHAQRRQECVLYDLLARLYDGEAARARR
jgi:lantibiotic biosynthesis protein